mmetsp:Transcript_33325/g.99206  ORF Transcript_33325/g.99206 Transcript_33325/m.99206 type:complete len:258 (+) Transcript_33325:1116-1889(+)
MALPGPPHRPEEGDAPPESPGRRGVGGEIFARGKIQPAHSHHYRRGRSRPPRDSLQSLQRQQQRRRRGRRDGDAPNEGRSGPAPPMVRGEGGPRTSARPRLRGGGQCARRRSYLDQDETAPESVHRYEGTTHRPGIESIEGGGGSGTDVNLAAPDALHRMLEKVIYWEWSLLGCFASSTPLELVHKLLVATTAAAAADGGGEGERRNGGIGGGAIAIGNAQETFEFDVEMFFAATSTAIDLMLNEAKVIAAFGCARA